MKSALFADCGSEKIVKIVILLKNPLFLKIQAFKND